MEITAQKKAFVTGVSGKIGRAIAYSLLEKGYLVYGTYLTRKIEAFPEELSGDFLPLKLDIRDGKAVFEAAKQVGRVDLLVNNAGIAQIKEITDITEYEWDNIMAVDLKGAFLCSKAFLPAMLEKKSGHIINVSSMWGLCGASCEVHYSAAKAGLIGFTKALAKEVGNSGIRVNAVAPGYIETSMTENVSQEIKSQLIAHTPVQRSGKGKDVADVVSMLIESEFITGEVINVSGGFLI